MADSFLQFSETLNNITTAESLWLQHQLEPIAVIDETEYAEDAVPDSTIEPSFRGLRFLRDYEDLDDDTDLKGFDIAFQEDGEQVYAWLFADAYGDVGRLAHLIRKFLKQFRRDQCWSLTYANTCSKLRVGEFGGGAVLVTADEIRWQSGYEFIEQQRAAFEARKQSSGCMSNA
jgi:hypothetical protein